MITLENEASTILRDDSGNVVSTQGTTTSGLQEFINLVASTGAPGYASSSLLNPFVLSTGIVVPPMFGTQIEIDGTINTATLNVPAFTFDTLTRCKFHHSGLISYNGSGLHAVLFRPTNVYAPNPYVSWQRKEVNASDIRLGSIMLASGFVNYAVRFDALAASFNNNTIQIQEVFCRARSYYGVYASTPDNQAYEFACWGQNKLTVGLIDAAQLGQFTEGDQPLVPSRQALGTNIYEFLGLTTDQPGNAYGALFSGLGNIAHIGSISCNGTAAHFSVGIQFAQGSFGNHVTCRQNEGTTPVANGGASSNTVV